MPGPSARHENRGDCFKDVVPAARAEIAMDRRRARAALLALNPKVLGDDAGRVDDDPRAVLAPPKRPRRRGKPDASQSPRRAGLRGSPISRFWVAVSVKIVVA